MNCWIGVGIFLGATNGTNYRSILLFMQKTRADPVKSQFIGDSRRSCDNNEWTLGGHMLSAIISATKCPRVPRLFSRFLWHFSAANRRSGRIGPTISFAGIKSSAVSRLLGTNVYDYNSCLEFFCLFSLCSFPSPASYIVRVCFFILCGEPFYLL